VRIDRLATPDLTRIFDGETVSGLSEYQLLERYRERHDETAFEALLARHGPMVLGVCRRMLPDPTDVDDAFQATFLVLVRRALELGPRDAIGPWLYGVATRVALRARSEAARRRRFAPIGDEPPARGLGGEDVSVANERELSEVLDQELSRLPTKYRSPVVLCYLEGQTHEEAARRLNWPLGTVKGRLARARDLLRTRLTRRGLAPTAGGLAVLLSRDSAAAVHRALMDRTVQPSLKLALGQTMAQAVSHSVASLAEGVLTAMLFHKLRWATLALLVSGLALTGAGVMARQARAVRPPAPPEAPVAIVDSAGSATTPSGANPAGDGSAPSANVREKSLAGSAPDLNQQRIDAARGAFRASFDALVTGVASLEQVYQASRRWMHAQHDAAQSTSERVAAAQDHLDRIKNIARIDRIAFGTSQPLSTIERAHARAFLAEAEVLREQAKAEEPAPPEEKDARDTLPGRDHRSRMVFSRLAEPIPMRWADETPLEEVLRFIKESTKSSQFPGGIPIYVDPIGLQEAEKSEQSTIKMDLEGVPLRRTLQLLLAQLGLTYMVRDGMVHITSEQAAEQATFIFEQADKALRGELGVPEMIALIQVFKVRAQVHALAAGARLSGEAGIGPAENSEERELRNRNDKLEAQLAEQQALILELLKEQREAKKAAESAPRSRPGGGRIQ
jgi:RNA polymerase sigma factor (sigma-70 family)